tara:strand:+ start:448 stop:936 length:489 start_codon:yes stop_codon:yes gene_type:complete
MIEENYRIGHGYDVHKLQRGEKFMIGGIEINHEKGAVGHSDADIAIHVICDSILGAVSEGDIGKHFPDTDEKYKGVDSKELLTEVMKILKKKSFEVNNIDVTVLLQKPKLRNHIEKMIDTLSSVMKIDKKKLSIKATTTEGLGFVGREEGVAAHCITLIKKI